MCIDYIPVALAVDAVVEALSNFEGALVFVSHDVHFIRKIASHVIHVEQGKLRHYPGPYDYYLDKTGQLSSRATQTSLSNGSPARGGTTTRPEDAKSRKRREAELRQALSKKRKVKQDEIKKYEQKYLARYKQPQSKPIKSKSNLYVLEEPKINIKKERRQYESEFLARYRKQQKAIPKKASKQLEWEPEPKKDKKQEIKQNHIELSCWVFV